MDVIIPRKDNEGKPIGPPIIELEFEKGYLDTHTQTYIYIYTYIQ